MYNYGWVPLGGTSTGTDIVSKVLYHNVSFLQGTLNGTNHCEVIIYKRVSRILHMTIHDNTNNSTIGKEFREILGKVFSQPSKKLPKIKIYKKKYCQVSGVLVEMIFVHRAKNKIENDRLKLT